MRKFLRHAHYCTVLSSEFKDILTLTHKKTPGRIMPPWWRNKEKNVVNQNQQMRAQKNRMDPPITKLHPPENKVDFDFL